MKYNHLIHFTIEEAKVALPDAIRLVAEMQRLKNILNSKGYDIYKHEYFGGSQVNGLAQSPKEMQELALTFQEFASKGYLLKNLEQGLMDFPAIRESGEEVYLCYLMGEPTIEFWHGLEGFRGRKELSEF